MNYKVLAIAGAAIASIFTISYLQDDDENDKDYDSDEDNDIDSDSDDDSNSESDDDNKQDGIDVNDMKEYPPTRASSRKNNTTRNKRTKSGKKAVNKTRGKK